MQHTSRIWSKILLMNPKILICHPDKSGKTAIRFAGFPIRGYNSSMQCGIRPVLIGLLIFSWCVALPLPSTAQSAHDPEDLTGIDGTVLPDGPESSGQGGLPEDVPTRESFTTTDMEPQQLGPSTAQYVQVFFALIIVIGVIWALSMLMKRLVTVRGLAGSADCLRILYTLSLSPTRTLYLVRLGDRVLLIGAGEGGLRTLAEIDDPSEVSNLLKELEFKGNFDLNPFKERLQSLVGADESDFSIDEDLGVRQRRIQSTLDRLRGIDDGSQD